MRVSLLTLTATVLSRGGLYLCSPSEPVGARICPCLHCYGLCSTDLACALVRLSCLLAEVLKVCLTGCQGPHRGAWTHGPETWHCPARCLLLLCMKRSLRRKQASV